MALLMLFAALWGVLQLTVLSSWSRSVRFSTLVLVVGFGAYACGVVAVGLQLSWTRLVATMTHTSLYTLVATASYTVDPVIEEVVKVLPLVLLGRLLGRVSRQLGLADHLLVGAATGAGFGLFESLMRYGTVKSYATTGAGGYLVQASLGGSVIVPSVGNTLTTWLPEPAQSAALLSASSGSVSHLAWTALAGLGVGWLWRGPRLRFLGILPLAFVSLDHMHYNYDASLKTLPGVLAPLDVTVSWLHDRLGLVVLVALVAAVVLDRRVLTRGRRAHPAVLLPGERADVTGPGSLLQLARVAPPLTVVVAARFLLVRRAALYAVESDPRDTELVTVVAGIGGQIGRAGMPARWAGPLAALRRAGPAARSLVRDWRVVVWILLVLPPVIYLVVGGFPFSRDVQSLARTTAGTWVVFAVAVAGLVYLAVLLRSLLRSRRAALAAPVGETSGRYLVRLGSGAGGLLAGVVLVFSGLFGGRGLDRVLVSNSHALDALGSLLIVLGLLLFLWGLFTFPPLALVVTTLGTVEIISTLTGAFVVTTAGASALGAAGVFLNEAADGSGGSSGGSGGSGGSGSAAARARRLEELAKDPAHGGRTSTGSQAEAEAGLGAEESGLLKGPIRRSTHPGEEFLDAEGGAWDVKAFRSEVPGGRGAFTVEDGLAAVSREVRLGEKVIVDTRGMSAVDSSALRAAVEKHPDLLGKVVFWP
jgi:hypothetical protein